MDAIGGQAIIEGVMFRTPEKVIASIRKPDGKIKVKELKLNLFARKFKDIFFIRGIFNLLEAMYVGIKTINYSAKESLDEKDTEKESSFIFILTFLVAIAFALFIFKFIPFWFATFFPAESTISFNIIEGIIKLSIFIFYIYLISKMKDIKILFQYHGAEHKTINCYEAKKPLIMKNVKKFSTLHKRCGTSFIFLVVIISILFYMLIPFSFSFISKFILRILFLPFIAGFAYEFLKFSAKHDFLTFLGMFIQKLTTKEPTEKQLEVSITGLKELLK